MQTLYKIILSGLVMLIVLVLGYKVFIFLDRKIKASQTGWQLAGYSILLFIACAALFFGGYVLLACTYFFLAADK